MPDIETDWDLVEQIKAGNDSAFDALMGRYKRPVLNFIFRMTGNTAEAEDLAQDLFTRAYGSILKPSFRRTDGAFSTWLFQSARNAAIDCMRRRKRHPVESLDAMADGGKTIPGVGQTPALEIMANETGRQIAAAIAQLPEEQRTAIILSEYENLSYAQIADIMKCSQKSVESRLYRARLFLRDKLAHLLKQHA